jgi:acetoin:2,6-dichlorophenolindophenol oxidoreductase subunit alpha
MDRKVLKQIYRTMVRIRGFEERAIQEYRKGLPGFIHSAVGQEVMPSAVCAFLREDDYVISNHRGHADIIAKGAKLDRMMAELFAKRTGYCKGTGGSMHISAMEMNILGATGIVGDGLPIAVGAALGSKMQGRDSVTVCFLGDGSTATGAFHEAMGIASVWDLPVVFACSNNLYSMGTPYWQHTKLDDLADRAKAYAIPGVSVDGDDPVAVAGAAKKAVSDARAGKGPTFIVGQTYRYYGHNMGDPSTEYRTREEVQKARENDPIQRYEAWLLSEKIMTRREVDAVKADLERELDEAVKFAQDSPEPSLEESLADIFTPSLAVKES